LAQFRRRSVPVTLVWMKGSGESMERSTCDSAAKLTTASIAWSARSFVTSAVSPMSPWAKT
jgi:hypothetical protein